jgi:peptidoglycan hydrolase CwlO-like protein
MSWIFYFEQSSNFLLNFSEKLLTMLLFSSNISNVDNEMFTKENKRWKLGGGKEMGLFTSKIITGVLAGGFTLGGAGLLFGGTQTLSDASQFVKDQGNKIVQYESNQNSLLNKIGTLKADASGKITTANNTIGDLHNQVATLNTQISTLTDQKAQLTTQVSDLQGQIQTLQGQITDLQNQLATANKNNADLQKQLDAKTADYNAKVAELQTANDNLAKANKQISNMQAALDYAQQKASEADKQVTQLEGEMDKANAAVKAHGQVVDQVKADTKNDQPLTNDQVNAVDTTTPDVQK